MKRLLTLVLLLIVHPAFADHPGERIDEVMTEQEPAFEVTDHPSLPELSLKQPGGDILHLSDLHDQIVVLSFVPRNCDSLCAEQQVVLAGVQDQVNSSPMKELVTFVTVGEGNVSSEAPWDKTNWMRGNPSTGKTTAAVADRFGALSGRGRKLPMSHIIDRNGRHAGIFHGSYFSKTNLTLYINQLINNAHAPKRPPEKGWWEWLAGWF